MNATFLEETLFIGELSLDGSIKSINGALPIAYDAHKLNKKRIIFLFRCKIRIVHHF